MKKLLITCFVAFTAIYSCTEPEPKEEVKAEEPINFYYTVESSGVSLPKGLQSFALGINSAGNWVVVGGRTNGLHNFSPPSFPLNKANSIIYIINPTVGAIDSFDVVNLLPQIFNINANRIMKQFVATNIQHTQVGNYLYLAGGYGFDITNKLKETYLTHNIVSRVDLDKLTSAISSKNADSVVASVATDTCSQLAVTGGELFKLTDGNFYLAVGHNFNGEYGNAGAKGVPQPTQVYTKKVSVFSITETANSISVNINNSIVIPSTPQVDSTSIFRRRDLVVAPAVVMPANQIGLGLYGGVFQWTSTISNAGAPFRTPIYISTQTYPDKEYYFSDSSYVQPSNLYSAANVLMYSPQQKTMLTSIFGGITNDNTQSEDGNPSWTAKILTISRQLTSNTYTSIYNPDTLPTYMGAEAIFVPSSQVSPSYYFNQNYNIFNYDSIPANENTFLGYIIGGIKSDSVQSSNTNPTVANNLIYKVSIKK